MGGRRLFAVVAAAVAAALILPIAAQASFHLMKVREVYPGSSNDSYVVLQMLGAGENFVGGHDVILYNATGTVIDTFVFSGGVPNGSHGNNTILVGDTGVQATFGVAPDDHADPSFNVPASGGAVCWGDGLPPDCVSWGDFTGSLPSSAGSPASPVGVTAGKALHRSIAVSGCPTYLESGDDTNNSASDFSQQTPNPRNNATTPTEALCSTPNTSITPPKPPARTNSTGADFTFTATPPGGATFECRLDAEPDFTPCASPKGYSGLAGGAGASHTFQVRAVHPTNGTDGTPATHLWTIDTIGPTASVGGKPADPSPGNSAAFTYSSSETGSSFQCSLAPGGDADDFSPCPSAGKTYPDAEHPSPLADGDWTFKVRATDLAGNQGSPAEFSWTVDNSLGDTTAPDTTIDLRPPDPSGSPAAFFTYHSTEQGSTFECKLDSAAFVTCPPAGVSYGDLGDGPHSFQVRATDGFGNTDSTPAGFSWAVSVAGLLQAPPLLPPGPPAPSPPQTTITGKPAASTQDRTPTFRFRSSVPGSGFECKVDGASFRPCASPFTTKPLSFGPHSVRIRAVAAGLTDLSPARSGFRVKKPKRKRPR